MTDQLSQTPPWGEDFDAEKAWTLIVNLRSDVQKAKDKADTETARADAAEKALAEAPDPAEKVTAAEKRAADAERALLVERAIRKHSIPDDLADFLTGDTEEEIEAKAARLASVGAKPGDEEQKPEDKAAEEVDESGRPKPALTPGHGGDGRERFDAALVVAAVREGRGY